MSTPSAQLALPQISGTDSPDVPRDINALITALEANVKYIGLKNVLEVGQVGQTRWGRFLIPQDFTNLNVGAPTALYNLSDLLDASSGSLNLTNKGAVTFGTGIQGAAAEAAIFAGSTAQVLYSTSTALNWIAGGTLCAWVKTGRRGTNQIIMSKYSGASRGYTMYISTANVLVGSVNLTAAATGPENLVVGITDIADDRWHHVAFTFDGTMLRLWVDGAPDAAIQWAASPIFASTAAFNIGGYGGDGVTASTSPFFGRIDEAFVTSNVLREDQLRYLMASKLVHNLAKPLNAVRVVVHRRQRGGALALTDFPSTPLSLHNLSTLTDLGSRNQPLVLAGAGTAGPGPNGIPNGAYALTGGSLSTTDASLPSGTASRSYGLWMKTSTFALTGIMGWGTISTGDTRIGSLSGGMLYANSAGDSIAGPFIADGQWHFVVVVEDNTAVDAKRKLYVDGRLVGSSNTLNSIALAGAAKYRVGSAPDATLPMTGMVARPWVIGVALTAEQIRTLYNAVSSTPTVGLDLPLTTKSADEHVEAIDSSNVFTIFDTLEGCDQVEVTVAA